MRKKKSLINLRLYHNKILRIRRKKKQRLYLCKTNPFNFLLMEYLFHSNSFIEYMEKQDFISHNYIMKEIQVPEIFSFKKNFNSTILFYKQLYSSYLLLKYETIIIDFSSCKEACVSCFTLMDIFFSESTQVFNKYNMKVQSQFTRKIKVIESLDEKVCKYLHAFQYKSINPMKFNSSDAYLLLGLEKGKDRTFKENRKSVVTNKVVEFINKSIKDKTDYQLNALGINAINGFIPEVLGNAEDHSLKGSEWYVNGISFYEKQHEIDIIELNLSIVNIGESMYEGFESTKEKNIRNYEMVEKLFNTHAKLFNFSKKYDRESLFTFYLLKEGFSRLKYKEASRGNGTMNFINAFMILGSFGESNENFSSDLNIVSGHTILSINNTFKPYEINGITELSLNSEKDVNLLPDKKCIYFNSEYFPGTILECKIFLNNDFLKKINDGNN